MTTFERHDVQGFVVSGYGKMHNGPHPGRWRHVQMIDLAGRGPTAIELSDHDGLAAAAASVAAARAVDNDTLRWAEPVRAGERPFRGHHLAVVLAVSAGRPGK